MVAEKKNGRTILINALIVILLSLCTATGGYMIHRTDAIGKMLAEHKDRPGHAAMIERVDAVRSIVESNSRKLDALMVRNRNP